jgi:hypothetical protein
MNLKPTSPSLFPIGSKLQHQKTGGFYQVMGIAMIEATLEPAYVYYPIKRMTTGSDHKPKWKMVALY